jgi:hypothetical protein
MAQRMSIGLQYASNAAILGSLRHLTQRRSNKPMAINTSSNSVVQANHHASVSVKSSSDCTVKRLLGIAV